MKATILKYQFIIDYQYNQSVSFSLSLYIEKNKIKKVEQTDFQVYKSNNY